MFLLIPLLYFEIKIMKYSNFHNLKTWVRFTLALIYNQLSFTANSQQVMLFGSWNKLVINEVLWILFTHSSLFSVDIHFEIFPFPKPHFLGLMHTRISLITIRLNCPYQEYGTLWCELYLHISILLVEILISKDSYFQNLIILVKCTLAFIYSVLLN